MSTKVYLINAVGSEDQRRKLLKQTAGFGLSELGAELVSESQEFARATVAFARKIGMVASFKATKPRKLQSEVEDE